MKKAPRFFSLVMLVFLSVAATGQDSDDRLANRASRNDGFDPGSNSSVSNERYRIAAIPTPDSTTNSIETTYKNAVNRLKQQAASIKSYAKANNFNAEYCFLVDMSIPSGKNRFFVYNLKKNVVEHSFLVAHGAGSYSPGSEQLQFSNTPNSYKTSLGKYKIGHSYYGTFGLAYKLYGLDTTNSKAFERAIVLHSMNRIPDAETYPKAIYESAGCPMVSRASLRVLNTYITSSARPVLLWIYN